MKLRESLTDRDGSGGTKVIYPTSIEIYPNNVLFFVWGILSSFAACAFWILFLVAVGIKANQKFPIPRRK